MTGMNPFKQLLPDLTSKPPLVPSQVFSDPGSIDKDVLRAITKSGITADILQKTIQADTQVSYERYNLYQEIERCLSGDTEIWLLDGTTPSIKEMADNPEKYVGRYTLSVNPNTLDLEPDKITAVGKTRKDAKLVRVHLDNGKYVDATPDHRFMLRTGEYVEAQDLQPQSSLMPLSPVIAATLPTLALNDVSIVQAIDRRVKENSYAAHGHHCLLNHKVVRVEELEETQDTYCLTIENNHNFPTAAGVFVKNCLEHWFVGPAVDLYANVSTTYNSLHNGTVWVTAENEKYQETLNDLFDRIGLEERIHDWAYTTAGYGDLFVKLTGIPGLGIITVEDSEHPMAISRVDYEGILVGFYPTPIGTTIGGAPGPLTGPTEHKLLPPWEYVHFRLLGAKKKRPQAANQGYASTRQINLISGSEVRQISTKYGSSIVTNALPSYKRLRLAEDSLLLARLTRGIIRYIWKLKVDMCLRGDTKIHLMNGTVPMIGEMADNPENYIGQHVLTVNEKTKMLEPNKILGVKKTRRNAQMVRVRLDNGKHVDCTPDHPFMMRDGTYKEAQNLQPRDSLMPYYSSLSEKGLQGYNLVYNPGTKKCCYEHRVAVGPQRRGLVVHHKDFNKLNNDPSNLQVMSQSEHVKWHHEHASQYGFSCLKGRKQSKKWVANSVAAKKRNGTTKHSEETIEKIRQAHLGEWETRECCHLSCSKTFDCLVNSDRKFCSLQCAYRGRTLRKGHGIRSFVSQLCACGCGKTIKVVLYPESIHKSRFISGHNSRVRNPKGRKEKLQVLNHKVVSVEWLNEREDTYDLQVENNHNFPLGAGVFVHNSNPDAAAAIMDQYATLITRARALDTSEQGGSFDSKQNPMTVCEDIFVPIWGDTGDLSYEKVGGEADIRWIVDIDMLRNQLSFALATPAALGGAFVKEASGALGSEAIGKLDIRFARSARRVQRALISGISRMCQIHLAYMGLDPDPKFFEVHMSETSTAEEESVRKSMESSAKTFRTWIETLRKVAGKKLDVEKAWEYYNEKVMKLEDFVLEDFYKDPAEIQAEAERTRAAQARKEPPAEEEGPSPVRLRPERVEVKRRKARERRIISTDLYSYLPVIAGSENIDKKLTEALKEKKIKVPVKCKGSDWLYERDVVKWYEVAGEAVVREEEVKDDTSV